MLLLLKATLPGTLETGGLLRDQFGRHPDHPSGMLCIQIRRNLLLQLSVTDLRNRPNSTVPLPEWPDVVCLLPLLPVLSVRTP